MTDGRGGMVGAVLFDYGGVLAEVAHRDDVPQLAGDLHAALAGSGATGLRVDDVEEDIRAGLRAYDSWKSAQSRRVDPEEITPAGLWELIACDWPSQHRAFVFANARALTDRVEAATLHRPARPEALATLEGLRDRGVRVGLVCNCLSGAVARSELRRDGLDAVLPVQVFSDEAGCRKPGRRIIEIAAAALGADLGATWFVGDKWNRDILGARRADVERAVLVQTAAGPGRAVPGLTADHEIAELTELLQLVLG